ncbi:MAG: transposase [Xenococcaceae cyanobacterium MO_207.B15]|nr:transposase [Xenococcaceae cyanobacterium MO_207.B15]MDJ0743140.1 transposase [Xenococcaceae cyanobacterium MO_167.B27]
MSYQYRTQKILLSGKIDDETESCLLWLAHQSNSLYNSALFAVRQAHFDLCETRTFFDQNDMYRIAFKDRYVKASYAQLCKDFKSNKHYIGLGGQQGQQCLKSVVEGVTSYNKLLKKYWQGEIKDKPCIPKYRKSRGLYQVAFPSQAVTYDEYEGTCKLAISKECKPELVNKELTIPGGYGFTSEQLAEVRIVPACGQLWAEYVYKTESKTALRLDYSQAVGIDPGVTNWLSVTSNKGKSFIVCGKKIKSINQRYNKKVAQYKKGKSEFYWDRYLDKITHKRNCQIKDLVNKAARFIINYCAIHGIGNIVFGWGQGVKNESKLGRVNNQNFVQIPTARLKNRIKELAESVGIVFTETEEAYTSKSSFLDGDLLPKYGEKPAQWRLSGSRITRGTYKTATGKIISCDAQAAANIMRKVATQLGISLAEVGREALILPKRYDLTCMSKSYRKRSEEVLLVPVATSV